MSDRSGNGFNAAEESDQALEPQVKTVGANQSKKIGSPSPRRRGPPNEHVVVLPKRIRGGNYRRMQARQHTRMFPTCPKVREIKGAIDCKVDKSLLTRPPKRTDFGARQGKEQ